MWYTSPDTLETNVFANAMAGDLPLVLQKQPLENKQLKKRQDENKKPPVFS